LICIEQVNDEFRLIVNEKHDLFVKIKDNSKFIQGLNLFATVLTNVRNDLKFNEEEKVFNRILEKINDEFTYLCESIGD